MIYMFSTEAPGGIRSVVEGYRTDGVFTQFGVRLIFSHREGSRLSRFAAIVSAACRLFVGLLRGRVDLVHCHAAMRGSFWRKCVLAWIARRFAVPVILHLHGSEMKSFYSAQIPILRRLITHQLEAATLVLVLSDGWQRYIQTVAPNARVKVLPNYVNVNLPEAVAERRHGVNFLFLGALGKRKGVYDLLQAHKEALKVHTDIRLSIGGNGDMKAFQCRVGELGIADTVEMLGWVSGSEKFRVFNQADVFILPSYNEGLPMAILEAMSFGLPVISTNVGAIPELIRGGMDGLLIEPGDISALTQAMIAMCESSDKRVFFGGHGRQRVRDGYSADAVLPKLYSIYQALMSST